MKFGPVPLDEALGAVAAHAVRGDGFTLRKGHVVTASDIAALRGAGIGELIAARLEPGDVPEDEAARRLAEIVAGAHLRAETPFTGRVNLFAQVAGVLRLDRAAIDAVNRLDEAITVATLPAFQVVAPGDMVATVKIIPFAAREDALRMAESAHGAVAVAPFAARRVAMVSTVLPGLKSSVIAKTAKALEVRLAPSGSTIVHHARCPHQTDALAAALGEAAASADLVVVFGASAITDRRDVIPAALMACGGRLEHLGMPVDPGNLLLLGEAFGKPLLGAPGCARSPRENGFDWVLQRLLADVPIGRADIQGMGVGGLLMEIASRPQPRADHE